MIESVVALLMFVNAEIKEARLQENMAGCLRGKRHAERQFSESVTYKCWKGSAELEDIDSEVKSMRNNAVNIEFLQKRTEKLTEDVEKLIRNGNGH